MSQLSLAALPDPNLNLAPLRMMVDDGVHGLSAPAPLEPISRPSSASTQASLAQLPGISSLAMGAGMSGRSSPQPKPSTMAMSTALAGLSALHSSTSSPAATSTGGSAGNLIAQSGSPRDDPGPLRKMATMANHDRETTQPICQNCATSTTPLWRRDEMGSVLCNACGLFLKLHGRPRPISLKTDVIKSRNRVKTSMRPDLAMKKKNAAAVAAAAAGVDQNGVVDLQSQAYAATAALTARRVSQKPANGHLDGEHSLGSAASGMYTHTSSGGYPMLDDGQYQSQHLQPFGASGTSPSRAVSPLNGDRMDPQNQDQLLAANSSLKTRVAELEVINDFIQRRLGHYEPPYGTGQDGQDANHQAIEAQLRSQVELLTQSETQLRSQLEESHRRENMLKRRLDELELELTESKNALGAYESGRIKRPRLSSPVADVPADALVEATTADVCANTKGTIEDASLTKDIDVNNDVSNGANNDIGNDDNKAVVFPEEADKKMADSDEIAAIEATKDVPNGASGDEATVTMQTAKQALEETSQLSEAIRPSSPKP
ncbi:gata transcription factor [Grosmannia clavigera kw1407]|uniref:Gata transcription factor n=1 Tax=Grosmannia clavigera (strain kw1407 / UAMH 11150) TaxID=655863 RepID=F0XFM5_GROCL|nr:gata transcription factor [Grosmannia clavigera kw1407]EFX04008.1 gata transcription factor [Grosmannia clavigera kw1407]